MARSAFVLLIGLLQGTLAASQQAFRPGELWPDNNGVHINAHGGGILVHKETFYWFGQHMIKGDAGNSAQVGVHVYSSKDLYSWKDEGIALRVSEDPQSDITKGCILERPKVIYNHKTGKFVMWFHLELKGKGYGAARSGVAVADQPTGPYRFVESFRPNAGVWPINVPAELKRPLSTEEEAYVHKLHLGGGPVPNFPESLIFRRDYAGGQMARDMTLFVDDDGTAFHIYASEDNGTLQISQLSEDYLRPAGKYIRVLPGGFNEAPAVFKQASKYYLITSGCTGWAPNAARLATADSIWGPWKSLGNPCVGKDADSTFHGQATHVLPVPGKPGAFIFMADRWQPKNAIDGRHLWLPIQFKENRPFMEWMDEWGLSFFDWTTASAATADKATWKAFTDGRFSWKASAPLVTPNSKASDPAVSIKDPTIVHDQDRWHMFATVRLASGKVDIEYLNFVNWKEADSAPRHRLNLHDQYYCAPQVFYFRPQKLWYLIYQIADKNHQPPFGPAYSTTTTLADPKSWSKPRWLFPEGSEKRKWIDFWVICDLAKAHLFYTSNDGRMWRCETKLADFPCGWSPPLLALQADIFEASHTYRLRGMDKYLTIVEAQADARRYYKAYLADRLAGPWHGLADRRDKPFAAISNVVQSKEWTTNISHGELLRVGVDETMEIDPVDIRFLFQGASDVEYRGNPYGKIPWRLGILEMIK